MPVAVAVAREPMLMMLLSQLVEVATLTLYLSDEAAAAAPPPPIHGPQCELAQLQLS